MTVAVSGEGNPIRQVIKLDDVAIDSCRPALVANGFDWNSD
jgi:hypothetical protein